MSDLPPTDDQLMQALQFSPADLQANRDGSLSKAQRQRLTRMRGRLLWTGGGVFALLALIATTTLFLALQDDSLILSIIGTVIVLVNALAMGLLGRQWMRLSTDLRRGEAVQTNGPLERVIRPNGRVNNYVLRVGEVEFSVKREVFKLFRHEQPYRLYSTPYAHVLLSAEEQRSA